MNLEKKYICVKKCLELDLYNLKHCQTYNPDQWKEVIAACPTDQLPEWEIINDN